MVLLTNQIADFHTTNQSDCSICFHFAGSERLDEDLEQATDFVCDERFSAKLPTCLVGLHTCGDLGGVALRLFLRQPQLHTACVVGCCYQQITEKNEIGLTQFTDQSDCSFPMTNHQSDCSFPYD